MPSKDFLALNPGYNAADMPGAKRRRGKRSAPGLDRPARAKAGDGDRVPDLMTLAGRGWTCTHYCHATGEHWMSGAAGETPRVRSYRQMLDDALKG
jgi:hypothetical protein